MSGNPEQEKPRDAPPPDDDVILIEDLVALPQQVMGGRKLRLGESVTPPGTSHHQPEDEP